jgi:putative glycosyltransferase (TIGR04372 family)
MGAIAEKELQSNNPMIIDYAMNGKRSDFLDVYLGARCHLFLCSDTGISQISEVFKRPVVYVNWVPLLHMPAFFTLSGLVILKKFYLSQERRFLTLQEIMRSEMASPFYGEVFRKAGVELIENTPQEIASAALELDDRIKGQWIESEKDKALQQSFWVIFDKACYDLTGQHIPRSSVIIGSDFLRKNEDFLKAQ